MTKALVVGVGLVACLLMMSGCARASTPLPPPPTDAEVTAAMVTYVDARAVEYGTDHPEVWENVTFKRFIEASESETFIGECTREFGVATVSFDSDGNMSWSASSDDDLVSTAVNACSLMYPNESMRAQVRTDAQLEYLYNYNTVFLGPCLASGGFEPEEPPALTDFVADSRRDMFSWTPYSTIDFEGTVWGNYDDDPDLYDLGFRNLMARCPIAPEGFVQWGW